MRLWIRVLLIASLTLNILAVAGFTWQRTVVLPRRRAAYAVEALGLRPEQQMALRDFQRLALTNVRAARARALPASNTLLESLRRETPNESEVVQGLTELAGIRVDVQRRILSDAVMFRSQLDAGQRNRFNQLLGTPDFVQRLAGIVQDPVSRTASPERE